MHNIHLLLCCLYTLAFEDGAGGGGLGFVCVGGWGGVILYEIFV